METTIRQVLSELLGPISLLPATGEDLGFVQSLVMRDSYEFYRARFSHSGQELLVVAVRAAMPVDFIARQYQRLQLQSSRPVLMAFKELRARERERLIRRKIPFIVPGKFLFAPMLGCVGETPMFEGQWNNALTPVRLSPWAETILIKRLLDDSLEKTSGIELAKLFDVTPMTISRALKELEGAELCYLVRSGTEKKIHFGTKDILWAKASKLLISPVVATVALSEFPPKSPLSGDPALEHYTMLVGIPPPSYAISKSEFLELKKNGKVAFPKPGEEKIRLELWRRDPRALAAGDYVDAISLYLTVKDSNDERVRSEARKMMNDLGFKVNENE